MGFHVGGPLARSFLWGFTLADRGVLALWYVSINGVRPETASHQFFVRARDEAVLEAYTIQALAAAGGGRAGGGSRISDHDSGHQEAIGFDCIKTSSKPRITDTSKPRINPRIRQNHGYQPDASKPRIATRGTAASSCIRALQQKNLNERLWRGRAGRSHPLRSTTAELSHTVGTASDAPRVRHCALIVDQDPRVLRRGVSWQRTPHATRTIARSLTKACAVLILFMCAVDPPLHRPCTPCAGLRSHCGPVRATARSMSTKAPRVPRRSPRAYGLPPRSLALSLRKASNLATRLLHVDQRAGVLRRRRSVSGQRTPHATARSLTHLCTGHAPCARDCPLIVMRRTLSHSLASSTKARAVLALITALSLSSRVCPRRHASAAGNFQSEVLCRGKTKAPLVAGLPAPSMVELPDDN
ncbi:hypothetical protein GGX14DRAFT_403320 [Mycena pura]|uniref:Uncharacterized protein n=1 Tax=Mycena pura TaxID=153505 RepID=A0AAD6Y2R0_9AGAR|nr:hypothetical protein GGX14DRAFT_403320 [Mycena pura]